MDASQSLQAQIGTDVITKLWSGVARAQKLSDAINEEVSGWIREQATPDSTLRLEDWRKRASVRFETETDKRALLDVLIGVAIIHSDTGLVSGNESTFNVDFVWELVRNALTNPLCHGRCYKGPQGCVQVYLCSLVLEGGKTDELYRVHVWMPNESRVNPEFRVHSHQAYAQSWTVAGEATDVSFRVEPMDKLANATHARYQVSQNFTKDTTPGAEDAEPQRASSTLSNAKDLFKATEKESKVHKRNMSYIVPTNSFHATDVPVEQLHATLHVFNSAFGWNQEASVLGPKDGESYTNGRYTEEREPKEFAGYVDDARAWEDAISMGDEDVKQGNHDIAEGRFKVALAICEASEFLASAPFYKKATAARMEAFKESQN